MAALRAVGWSRKAEEKGEDSRRRSVTTTHLRRAGPGKVTVNKREMVGESHDDLLRITRVTWRNPNVHRAQHRCSTREQQKPGSTSADGDPGPAWADAPLTHISSNRGGGGGVCETQAAQKGGWRPAPEPFCQLLTGRSGIKTTFRGTLWWKTTELRSRDSTPGETVGS